MPNPKKKKYRVTVYAVVLMTHEVDAMSKKAAEKMVLDGIVDMPVKERFDGWVEGLGSPIESVLKI